MRTLILAAALIAAPAAAALGQERLRGDEPFIEQRTDKSLGQLSGCIARAWDARKGLVSYVPNERGFTISLSYVAVYLAVTGIQVEVEDSGTTRLVRVFASKGERKDRLRDEIKGCL